MPIDRGGSKVTRDFHRRLPAERSMSIWLSSTMPLSEQRPKSRRSSCRPPIQRRAGQGRTKRDRRRCRGDLGELVTGPEDAFRQELDARGTIACVSILPALVSLFASDRASPNYALKMRANVVAEPKS